jgi:uncharacterized membrane protein
MKKYFVFIALAISYNVLSCWWQYMHPDVFMFNLVTFFVIPCLMIGIVGLTIVISLLKKKYTKNELLCKFILIMLLVFVMLQYNSFSSELVV